MSAFDELEVCRNILESLPTGLCVLDMQKRVVFWSDGAERITGRFRHEVMGHSCIAEALLHCRQSGCEFCREDCAQAQAMKTGKTIEAMGFLHHKCGYEVPVRVRAVPVHNPHGSIIGAVEIFDNLDLVNVAGKSPRDGIDELTGICSEARTKSCLQEALAAFVDRQISFAVLRFRLHGLKRFRAAFGPDTASSLLRAVAHTLVTSLPRTDMIGRWPTMTFW